MKLLSIDQACNVSAWASMANGKLENYGLIDLSKLKTSEMKISALKHEIEGIVFFEKIEVVSLEDIQYQGMLNAYKPLAMLFGVLTNYLFEQEILYFPVNQATWKASCGITGVKGRDAQKQAAKEFVLNQYKLDIDSYMSENYPQIQARAKKKNDYDLADVICQAHHVTIHELPKIQLV